MRRLLSRLIAVVLMGLATPAAATLNPEIEFKTIEKQYFSGHKDKKNYVIRNRDEWQALWELTHAHMYPKPELPEVDFDRRMIVAVFMGEQTSGGYSIAVTGLVKTRKKLKVMVRETSPGVSCGVIAALTQPYHIIETARVAKVSFRVDKEVRECP